MIISKTLYPLQ